MEFTMRLIKLVLDPGPDRPVWRYWRLACLSAIMLAASYMLARPNQPFFYQGF